MAHMSHSMAMRGTYVPSWTDRVRTTVDMLVRMLLTVLDVHVAVWHVRDIARYLSRLRKASKRRAVLLLTVETLGYVGRPVSCVNDVHYLSSAIWPAWRYR